MSHDLSSFADMVIEKYQIPAVSLAVLEGQNFSAATSGCLNVETGLTATNDTVFEIGSITKVLTTCLVMQLVDEGKVSLDMPVKAYLPDFRVADAFASDIITVRQLLNHTNGIAGDYFPDDNGLQGNLIARYVDCCRLLPLVHPVGEMFCYSNAAFVVAGRLVEVLRDVSWHEAIEMYIFQPLGLMHSIADPRKLRDHSAAAGHIFGCESSSNHWILPESASLTRGMAPAGTVVAMSANDLILFADAFLRGGVARNGERWLSLESVELMQTPSYEWPIQSLIKHNYIGLGWMITDFANHSTRVIHHGGATSGFLSMLQLIPQSELAVAVLINGFSPYALTGITNELLIDLIGLEAIEPEISCNADASDFGELIGHYESLDSAVHIFSRDNKLEATITPLIDPLPAQTFILRHISGYCFASYSVTADRGPNITFVVNSKQSKVYLFLGVRLIPKLVA